MARLPRSSTDGHVIVHSSDKKSRVIFRQRIVIQILVVLFLLVLLLFVWQLTVNITNKKNSDKDDRPTVNTAGLLELEARRCPIVPSQQLLPRTLPVTVSNALHLDDLVFKSVTELTDLEGLAASLIYKDKVVWKKTFGVRDSKASSPTAPDENTVFRVASVSKILTVLFVFYLLEAGSISSLDDPLDKYEPNFVVINKFNSDKITLRHILTHTSGLPREVPCGEHWSTSDTNICPVNTTYVLKQLQTTSLKCPPGTEPNYSNLGFALMAHILAQRFANGKYEQWVVRNILLPLHMTSSGFNLKSMSSNKAVSYGENGLNSNVDWGWASPAFQLYSTTGDLSKLMMALFQATPFTAFKVIKSDFLLQILTPNFVYPDGSTMVGLGWEMKLTGSYILVSKSGIVPGYSAAFTFYPKLQLGVVVLMTGRETAPVAAELLLKPLAQKLVVYLVQQDQINVPPDPNKYIGSYDLVSKWIETVIFNITLQDGVLQLHQIPGFPQISYLNYVQDNVLELVYKPGFACPVYGMGQNHERFYFKPAGPDGTSPEFQFGSFQFIRTKQSSKSSAPSRASRSKMILSKMF